MIELVDFTPALASQWDAVAAAAPHAWFWHTSAWMEWVTERMGETLVANRSFLVVDHGRPIAICPVLVEATPEGRRFAYAGVPLPCRAVLADVPPSVEARVLARYAAQLAELAAKDGVDSATIKVPSLAPGYIDGGRPFANPFLRLGFFDVPYLTQVIDLRPPLATLWSAVRKGHRADINVARRRCRSVVWDRTTVTSGKFRQYQELHAKDVGHVARSQRTFDLMEGWVQTGDAALVEVECDGTPAAFALLLLYKGGAFYGSGCKDPDRAELPSGHLAQWASIEWLKANGYVHYDLGPQQFGPQWFAPATAKDVAIAAFKRGFGGVTVPLVTAERFYSRAVLKATLLRRLDDCLAAIDAAPAEEQA